MIKSVIADCWVGNCDWERPFGPCKLNLTGMTAEDADERSRRYWEVTSGARRPTNDEIRETRRVQAQLENAPSLPEVRKLLAWGTPKPAATCAARKPMRCGVRAGEDRWGERRGG